MNFWLYIRSRLKNIILFIGSAVIAIAFCWLYALPFEPIIYAFCLIFLLTAVLCVLDIIRCIRKHKSLSVMAEHIETMSEELSEPDDPLSADYVKIIKALCNDRRNILTEHANEIRTMTDYYNVWVHQIKTPIAAMLLILQTDDNVNPEIEQQLFRIDQYVDMVLNYLRSSANSTDYVIKQYPLDDIIKSAVRKFSIQFIRQQLSLNYDGTDAFIYTDAKWLEFVVGQLLSNALKYTEKGHITITATSKCLTVADTGIGIDSADLPRVFENGYTGYNGREDKKSTGIGLYLCKRVLNKLGHSIAIESEKGKGTAVHIIFNKQQKVIE